MSNSGKNVLNLSKVVASPILTGKNDKYMWTGVVKSSNITPYIISDEKTREKFKKLVRDLENSTRRFRSTYSEESNILRLVEDERFLDEADALEEHILDVATKIKDMLNESEELGIDMGLFWAQLCRDYEEILENNPQEFEALDKEQRKNLERFRISLNSSDPCVREVYIADENRYVAYQYLTLGQERKYGKISEGNVSKMMSVISGIAGKEDVSAEEGFEILREVVTPITLIDLPSFFPYKRYAEMQYVTVFKNYLLKKGYTSEEIESMSIDEITEKAMDTYNTDKVEFHSSLMTDAIVSGLDYVDLEKLFLTAMVRPLTTYDLMSPKVEETDSLIKPMQELKEQAIAKKDLTDSYIQQECSMDMVFEKTRRTEFIIKKILETGIVSKKAKIYLPLRPEERDEEFTLKRLEKMMDKFCDGIYLTDVIELNLLYSAYLSEDEMSKWSDDLVKRINFSENDKIVISMVNFDNLRRLYSLGKLDKSDIEKLLVERKEYESEFSEEKDENTDKDLENITLHDIVVFNYKYLVKNLYDEKILSVEELGKYFKEGLIPKEALETLEYSRDEDELRALYGELSTVFNEDVLLENYKEYVEEYVKFTKMQQSHPENTEEIEALRENLNKLREEKDTYLELYNKYNFREEMTEDQKHALGESLLEKYFIEMGVEDETLLQESIKVLYEDGMIDLENIIGLDKKYITPMLDKLSLEDASKIRNSMDVNELEELIDGVFNDPSFSDERRFIVVMNLAGEDSEYDKMIREYYLGLLQFDNESERKAKPQGIKRNMTGNGTKESNKYIYPDFVKWKFYKGLDKDVRVTRYANGFVEFASSKLGVRIIEKYYDGDKPAYGTATYILPEQDYRKNQSSLVTLTPKGSILESASLREITPRKDRIAHRTQSTDRTWMDDMVRYFDIDYQRENDSRYTKEELASLEKIVKTYKTEYEMI